MSAFEAWTFKMTKVVAEKKKKTVKEGTKETTDNNKVEKVASVASSVSDDTKLLIAKAKKLFE
eukprot:804559-Ditylum_brightwellii.AAC.1